MLQTILFDIDGVMLSEERYFDASALTVFELLSSSKFLGLKMEGLPPFQPQLLETDVRTVREAVFADDHVLKTMKQCGVNANWDMVYLQTAFQITEILQQLQQAGIKLSPVVEIVRNGWNILAMKQLGDFIRGSGVKVCVQFDTYEESYRDSPSKQYLFSNLNDKLSNLLGKEVRTFDYQNTFWNMGKDCFQEWYLGDEYNPNTSKSGKNGFLKDEVPIVDPKELSQLFTSLLDRGFTIGIATGRPSIETQVPLESFGWLQYFSRSRVSTASDVLDAEQAVPSAAPLSKPHPYAYLRSYLHESDPKKVLQYPLPLSSGLASQVLVVGDSVADLLAARAIGCRFAAVLTGLEGAGARHQFEERKADFIIENVLELTNCL